MQPRSPIVTNLSLVAEYVKNYPRFFKNSNPPGGSKLQNRLYLSKYAFSLPQNPLKSSMNGYKPFEYATNISNSH